MDIETVKAAIEKAGSSEWYFYRSYVGAALWSTNDESDDCGGEPLDSNYDESDLSEALRAKMKADCAAFYAANSEHIHCSEREDFESAARKAGWREITASDCAETRAAQCADFRNGSMFHTGDWESLCETYGIEPVIIPGAPLANDMDGSIAAREAAMAGHDFWLTRCGHGAGFWDGDWPEPAATALTEASKAFRNVDLYVGDDGEINA